MCAKEAYLIAMSATTTKAFPTVALGAAITTTTTTWARAARGGFTPVTQDT